MNGLVFESTNMSREAQEQKWQRILMPLLNELLDENSLKEISVDRNYNLKINGVSIGNSLRISNFEIQNEMLTFEHDHKRRYVDFGMKGFQPCNKVISILEGVGKGFKEIYPQQHQKDIIR